MSTVCPPFAAVLQQARDEFNHRFTLARRTNPQLDAGAFTTFLYQAVDPLIARIAEHRPDAVFDAVSAAYDTALDLATHGLLGGRARALLPGWCELLPAGVSLVAQSPNRMFAAVSNALHHLASCEGARPADWIRLLTPLLPHCADVETFLRLGSLAAWRAGLAHYRLGALEVAASLPPALARPFLGGADDAETVARGQAWRENPWQTLEDGNPAPADGLRLARFAGAFRGFGGLFPEPPRVAVRNNELLVASGPGCWLLTADAFGATFHRITAAEWGQAKEGTLPRGYAIQSEHLTHGKQRLALADFGPVTSKAATSTTLALTTAYSHAVLLVPLT